MDYAFFNKKEKTEVTAMKTAPLLSAQNNLSCHFRSGMDSIIRLFQILPTVENHSPTHTGPVRRLFLKEKAVWFKIIIHSDLPAAFPSQEMVCHELPQFFPQCLRLCHCFQIFPALEFNLWSAVFL